LSTCHPYDDDVGDNDSSDDRDDDNDDADGDDEVAMTMTSLTTGAPSYLSQHLAQHVATRQTRSTALPLLTIPRIKTEFARRSYSYSAPFTGTVYLLSRNI